jgi:hypothetical protein
MNTVINPSLRVLALSQPRLTIVTCQATRGQEAVRSDKRGSHHVVIITLTSATLSGMLVLNVYYTY